MVKLIPFIPVQFLGDTSVKYSDADADTIRFLIKNGADVNTKDELGISLTHLAVKNCLESDDSDYQGNIKILAALIEHGADINSCDENGLPPLAYTINSRKFELIKFLLENGADIRINKHLGTHLLCEAVEHRKIDIVERLIDKGVNVNSDVLDGCPLLIWSIYNNLTDSLISLIIEKGAEIDSRDSSNKRTPLHYAVAYDRYTVNWKKITRKLNQNGIVAIWIRETTKTNKIHYHLLISNRFSKKDLEIILENSLPKRNKIGGWHKKILAVRPKTEWTLLSYFVKAKVSGFVKGKYTSDKYAQKRFLFRSNLGLRKFGTIGKFWGQPMKQIWKTVQEREVKIAKGFSDNRILKLGATLYDECLFTIKGMTKEKTQRKIAFWYGRLSHEFDGI